MALLQCSIVVPHVSRIIIQMMFLFDKPTMPTTPRPSSSGGTSFTAGGSGSGAKPGSHNKQFVMFRNLTGGGDTGTSLNGSGSKQRVATAAQLLGDDVGGRILAENKRKRRVVELSDSEEGEEWVTTQQQQGRQGDKRQKTQIDSDQQQDSSECDENSGNEGDDNEDGGDDDQSETAGGKWWLARWPRELTREAETRWSLAL